MTSFRYRTDQPVDVGDRLVNDDNGHLWRVLAVRRVRPRRWTDHRYVFMLEIERLPDGAPDEPGVDWHGFVRDRPRRRP